MKKLNIIFVALLAVGACVLNPLTPPPPAMDWNDPTNSKVRKDLVDEINGANLVIDGHPVTVQPDGTLVIPADAVPDEYKNIVPTDENGNLVFDLHSIEVQDDGSKHIVYKIGDSYVAAVYVDGKLSIKNSPTIDYGTIDWGSEGIFNTDTTAP